MGWHLWGCGASAPVAGLLATRSGRLAVQPGGERAVGPELRGDNLLNPLLGQPDCLRRHLCQPTGHLFRTRQQRFRANHLVDQTQLPGTNRRHQSAGQQEVPGTALAHLANTGDAALAERVAEPLARLRRAAAHLCHPDGEIALLNDSAFGIANPPGDLIEAEARPGPFALPQTGYYGARSDAGHYVIEDAHERIVPLVAAFLERNAIADSETVL